MSWVPVANSTDLVARHVFQGKLEGNELAIWRADDGHVNIWENRCLHRGVRLSIGVNTGSELVCQYHGWRYANRTAGCTYIPAHPASAPARTICNRTYPVLELAGLVWTHLEEAEPQLPYLTADGTVALRALPIHASAKLVADMLPELLGHGLQAETMFGVVSLFVQTVDSDRTILRGIVENAQQDRLATMRHFNDALTSARRKLEDEATNHPAQEPMAPSYAPVSADLAEMPAVDTTSSDQTMTIARKTMVGKDICSLELVPLDGLPPTVQPGGHVDIRLPNGMTRQYSLVNSPAETDRLIIGVKRDETSRGGSIAIHDDLKEMDLVQVNGPHNNFPLRRDATRTILLAGGIGATPLLSMAAALKVDGDPFEFYYFAQSADQMAFPERLEAMGDALHREVGLDPKETEQRLTEILSTVDADQQIYVCGPGPMIEITRRVADAQGWPESQVHFEYFKNTRAIDDGNSFEIDLARSALTLTVPAGHSILSVLRDNGVAISSSCEQGACGTCEARVLEGEVDHQDVALSNSDHAANEKIMTCVSRAKSARLVLDL